jgi:hypothetical protein
MVIAEAAHMMPVSATMGVAMPVVPVPIVVPDVVVPSAEMAMHVVSAVSESPMRSAEPREPVSMEPATPPASPRHDVAGHERAGKADHGDRNEPAAGYPRYDIEGGAHCAIDGPHQAPCGRQVSYSPPTHTVRQAPTNADRSPWLSAARRAHSSIALLTRRTFRHARR